MAGYNYTSDNLTGFDFAGSAFTQVYAATFADLRSARGTIAVLAGYYAAGDGGGGTFVWSDVAAVDDGGVVVNPTPGATSAGWRRLLNGDLLNILWFGAQENETADATREARNSAAIAAAIAAAAATVLGLTMRRTVYVPPGTWWFADPIVIPLGRGLRIAGAGPLTTTLCNQHGTMFSFAAGAGLISHFELAELGTLASAGRVFEAVGSSTGIYRPTFTHVQLRGTSTSHELFYLEDRYLQGALFDNCIFSHVSGSTVPAVYLVGDINANEWRHCAAVSCGRYFFRLESTSATAWVINNQFRSILFAGNTKGAIEALGARNLLVDECNYNLGTISENVFSIGPSTNAAPLASQDITFRDCHRNAGALTGYDIALDASTVSTVIDHCHAQGGTAYKLSLADTPVLMYGVRGITTVDGDAQLTWLRQAALVLDNKTGVYTGTGDPNTVQDGAKGSLYLDETNDTLYRKTTNAGTLTGWVVV